MALIYDEVRDEFLGNGDSGDRPYFAENLNTVVLWKTSLGRSTVDGKFGW